MGLRAGLDECGIRSTHRPARSESLYRLRYPRLPLSRGTVVKLGVNRTGLEADPVLSSSAGNNIRSLPTFIHMSSCHGAC